MRANKSSTAFRTARRALVVDDDKFMQTVLGDMLRDLGVLEIGRAANGSAAMETFRRMKPAPDVVLCDLHMPGTDGFQFMEQLGAQAFDGGVVLVSGMNDRVLNSATLMARFHHLNILATLSKPVDESMLREALAKLR